MDIVKGCLGDFFVFWDDIGARFVRERYLWVFESSEFRVESSGIGGGKIIFRRFCFFVRVIFIVFIYVSFRFVRVVFGFLR